MLHHPDHPLREGTIWTQGVVVVDDTDDETYYVSSVCAYVEDVLASVDEDGMEDDLIVVWSILWSVLACLISLRRLIEQRTRGPPFKV